MRKTVQPVGPLLPRCYRLHGLSILSPLPLGGEEIAPKAGEPITLIIQPPAELSPVPANARVLSRFEFHDGVACSHVQDRTGFLSTYFGNTQFRLDVDQKTIKVTVTPGLEQDWVKILMAASYPAFLLFLAGRVPLHASAVWLPGLPGALGVLGTPGAGKTTLAGALCLAGAKLISDDLLSLDPGPGAPQCQPGSRQLRLRQASDELAARFTPQRVAQSADGRIVVDAREDLPAELPLKALVQPVLDREAMSVRLERLSGAAAFQALATDPRIKGLNDPAWIRAAFEHAARLAREVPVYRAIVPFRERNFGEIGRSLVGALEMSGSLKRLILRRSMDT